MRVALALLAVYLVWGSTYLAMRVALETIPPFLMSGPRFVVAGALMYFVARLRGAPRPSRAEWVSCAKVGTLLLTMGNGAVALAEQSVTSSVAAIVVASMPIWAAVVGRFAGARTTGREGLGLALGFLGVVLLNLGGQLHFDARGLVLLVAPVAWAAGSVWSSRLPMPRGSMAPAMEMIVAGGSMLLLAVATGERMDHVPSSRSLAALAYLTVFGSIVALTAYTWLLRNTRPAVATSYAYVNPLVAVLLGAYAGGEAIHATSIAAALVSLAGVALIAKRTRRD
jgi:drug/metabolite transporter (DMT)-like permease